MFSKSLFVCLVLILSPWLCARSVKDDKDEFYTNSWAVEIPGGRAVADDVARRHGFLNMGQVSLYKLMY